MDIRRVIHYECPVCETLYTFPDEAEECLARGIRGERPDLRVGDIVTCGAGFGWFDGDPAWVVNPDAKRGPQWPDEGDKHGPVDFCGRQVADNCFDWCCTMGFYWVITKMMQSKHMQKIMMRTGAMKDDNGHSYKSCYGGDCMYIQKIDVPPPSIRGRAAELVEEVQHDT